MSDSNDNGVGRREFVGVAAAAAGITILKPSVVFGTQANSAVRLGILGCGGRGTNVMGSFLENTGAVLTAIGDLFPDNLEAGRKELDAVSAKLGKPAVDPAHLFKGPKAYEALFASKDVDAVYIATPPFFHPMHAEAALAAGKHVYLEKPVGVDVPGAKKVMALGETAKARKLSLAVGFQIRHASAYVELAKRVHEGQIGQPVSGAIHYFASAIQRPDWPTATPAERRLRNWVHDKALSGDIIVEQNVHIIDVTNWFLRAHPVKAVGSGGRAGRTDKGDAWSHFNCVFTYPGDVAISFASTQFTGAQWGGVAMQYYGTKGWAEAHYDAPVRLSARDELGVPGARQARGHRRGGRRDREVLGRPRRRRPQQAEVLHRQHHQRQPAERGPAGRGVGTGRDAGPDGRLHRRGSHLGEAPEVEGGLRPKDGYEAVHVTTRAKRGSILSMLFPRLLVVSGASVLSFLESPPWKAPWKAPPSGSARASPHGLDVAGEAHRSRPGAEERTKLRFEPRADLRLRSSRRTRPPR